MAKVFYTKETQNMETGEITTRELYRKQTDNADQFARIFFQDLSVLLLACTGAELRVALSILQYLEYNTNEFILVAERRASIGKAGNIKPYTVSASISKLLKKNIFIKKSSCVYILNPRLFFYGDEKGRKQIVSDTKDHVIGGKVSASKPKNKKTKA